MFFYLWGLYITGLLFIASPWDSIPSCLPQILLETIARGTTSNNCILTSDITRWFGAGTLMCMLPSLSTANRRIIAGTLIIAGLLALGIIFIYSISNVNCRQTILPCRAKSVPIVLSVGVVQLLLAVGGLRKIMRREDPMVEASQMPPVKPEA